MRPFRTVFPVIAPLCLLIAITFPPALLAQTAPVVVVAPDGSGDFTTDGRDGQVQINQALDFVAAHPGFTTVYLKGPNTYWIDATIFISSNTTLTGDPDAKIKLVNHARWRTKFMPLIGQKGHRLEAGLEDPSNITENIVIHGFEIDGNRQRQNEPSGHSYYNMISLQNTRNIRIYDMYMHDNLSDVLNTGYDLSGFDINLDFYDNRVHASGHDGVFVINSRNIRIHDNIFTDNRTDAHIRVQYCDDFRIYNNIGGNDPDRRFSGGIGVSLQVKGDVPLSNAEIYNNFFYGRGAYYGIWLWQLKGVGQVDSHRDVYIHDNVIVWSMLGGIGIQGFQDTRIENNIFEADAGYGETRSSGIVFIGGDPGGNLSGFRTYVSGNIIINHPGYGLDNQTPALHQFVSRNNRIFGNLAGPYNNAASNRDRYDEPGVSRTLVDNYYNILAPAWTAAHESNDFSGDLGAVAAWRNYRQ